MSHYRSELHETLCQYGTDTLTFITAVKDFCEMFPGWKNCRENEVEKIRDIKKKADKIDPSFTKSEDKETSSEKPVSTLNINSVADLENVLGEVLTETLKGLEKLNTFLDAVEKLAVTSLQVFTENQILFLPEGISFDKVQALIKSARLTCPLILEFKRDAAAFFVPKRHNVEVLLYQLGKYIDTTERIYENLSDSKSINISLEITDDVTVECDLSDDLQKLTDQIKQLDKIRKDDDFRMMFLFQRIKYSEFVKKYNDELPEMLQFLDQIEKSTVKLDSMNKGAKISSVTGSSVGAVGGILSIVGLALIPFTAGVSMGLTIAGASLGATSAVNSLVTTAVEAGVNNKQTKQANAAFQRFMFGVQRIQDCLEEAAKIPYAEVTEDTKDVLYVGGKIAKNVRGIEKAGDFIVDVASAINAGKAALQEGKAVGSVSNVASDVPKIGQAAAKGSLAISKGFRVGFIAANALFLGMDIFVITKDSMALAKGTETNVSKFLRARADLWRSEIEAWEKICNSLCRSKLTAEENREMLEKQFYPI